MSRRRIAIHAQGSRIVSGPFIPVVPTLPDADQARLLPGGSRSPYVLVPGRHLRYRSGRPCRAAWYLVVQAPDGAWLAKPVDGRYRAPRLT